MRKTKTFEEVLEAADKLSEAEREAIIDILRKRMIDRRRKEILAEVKQAQADFQKGICHPVTAGQIVKEITS